MTIINKRKLIYILFACLLVISAGSVFVLSPYYALACISVACILLYIASIRLLAAGSDRMRLTVILWFLAFLFFLTDATMLNSEFYRNSAPLSGWSIEAVTEYAKTHLFLHPFDSFSHFIGGYQRGVMAFKWVFLNIFGNFVAFMPFAFFLPYLIKGIDNFIKFLLCIVAIVLFVELMQLVLMTGYADVDDLILNCTGAMIAYFVINNGLSQRLMRKIHL